MAIHDDIPPYLTANGLGVFGQAFWWGSMPDEPDDLLTFYETAGPGGLYTKMGPAQTEARLQVLSRATSYETAMSRALQVYALLDEMRETLGTPGTSYHIRALQRPFDVGAQDDPGRTIISCNYALFIR